MIAAESATHMMAEAPYKPLGGAEQLWRCRDGEILYEGPAGTGKTRASLEKLFLFACNYPGTRCLILRKVRASMNETVLVTWEQKVLPYGSPILAGPSRAQREFYDFPNGTRIVLGGMDHASKVLSSEYDFVLWNQAEEGTEDDWESVLTRLRWGTSPYRQMVAEVNPSYPAHWLNQRAQRGQMTRILSRHSDNPTVMPEYLARLDKLSGHRRARLFLGQWAAAEGLVYDRWDEAVFVRERPGVKWERAILSIDEGYANPCAIGFWLVDGDGYPHLADEWYKSGELEATVVAQAVRFSEFAQRKLKLSLEAVIVDPSAAKLIAALGAKGLPVTRADNDVLPGIASVQARLTTDDRGRPTFTVSPRCTAFRQEIASYIWQTNRDGTKRDAPVKVNDHSQDQARYFHRYLDKTSQGLEAFAL